MAYFCGTSTMNASAPNLTTSDATLATVDSSCPLQRRPDVLAVDVAREEVRRGDRHDRRGHERADGDRGEREAHEPRRERVEKERGHGEVRAVARLKPLGVGGVLVDPRRERHVPEQRDEREQERVGRQHRRVAPDDVAAARAEDAGHRVRIEKERQRRAQGQRRVGRVLPEVAPLGA